jgi:hypothetical protein
MSGEYPTSERTLRTVSFGLFLIVALLTVAYIVSRRSASFETSTTPGIVRDETANPVAGACVRYKGTADFVVTDAGGRFELPRGAAPDGSVVTASREGHVIVGAPRGRSPLELFLLPLPKEDFEPYAWVDPAADPAGRHNCANCHQEMYDDWAASSHSRSATGRHFRSLYDGTDWHGKPNVGWSLLGQYPDGAGVCASCHAPTASFVDTEFDLRKVKGVAARGVHCDYCHKIVDSGQGKLGLTHGRDGIRLLRPARDQLFFGPLDDVDRGEDSFSPLYRDSKYCASCHEGVVFGKPVYTTYSEWLDSPARQQGKQCQSCHMTPTGKMTNFAPGKGGIERDPETLASHRFPGGELDMLRRCLKVSVTCVPDGSNVKATVEVTTDQVGHRVPTGFIDRNLLLVVEGLDGDGKKVTAEAGPTLPGAAGRPLAGMPGKLYAKLLVDEQGRSPLPFWKAAGAHVVDTRLLPGHTDRVEHTFPARLKQVRVRLIYRRFWKEVAEEKGWPDEDVVILELLRNVGV